MVGWTLGQAFQVLPYFFSRWTSTFWKQDNMLQLPSTLATAGKISDMSALVSILHVFLNSLQYVQQNRTN